MLKQSVILTGGAELTGEGNVRALTDAGYLVFKAHTLDSALVSNELYEPMAMVVDTQRIQGDIAFFCETLAGRPNSPAVFLVCGDGKNIKGALPLPADVQRLRSPLSPADLIARVNGVIRIGGV